MNNITLLLATTNKNKIDEMSGLLSGQDINIRSLDHYKITEGPREDADTFLGNAAIKARHFAALLGLPALADDSGLVVESLGGMPGVHSARWAGESATDAQKCTALLKELEGSDDRNASFVCALVLAVPTGEILSWTGKCDGVITREPKGANGFGYDPIFYYPPQKKTFAEITKGEKGLVSHRGRALAQFSASLQKTLKWLENKFDGK